MISWFQNLLSKRVNLYCYAMGFKPAIEKILRYVPANRQTLLFSATVSDDIKRIAAKSLRPGHVFVDCVGENDTDSATNPQAGLALSTRYFAVKTRFNR
jgi:superfamily II DNA/RNA helicase